MKRKKKETKDKSKGKKILKGAAKVSGVMAMGLFLNGVNPSVVQSADLTNLDDTSYKELGDLMSDIYDELDDGVISQRRFWSQRDRIRDAKDRLISFKKLTKDIFIS